MFLGAVGLATVLNVVIIAGVGLIGIGLIPSPYFSIALGLAVAVVLGVTIRSLIAAIAAFEVSTQRAIVAAAVIALLVVATYHSTSLVWVAGDMLRCAEARGGGLQTERPCPESVRPAEGERPAPYMPPWTQDTRLEAVVIASLSAGLALAIYLVALLIPGRGYPSSPTPGPQMGGGPPSRRGPEGGAIQDR